MDLQLLAIVLLATFCAGAVAWVLVYPYLSGEKEVEKRMQSVARPGAPAVKSAPRAITSSPEQVESSLKEIENRTKQRKSPPLSTRIAQAGVSWTKQQFTIGSAGLGLVVAAGVLILRAGA